MFRNRKYRQIQERYKGIPNGRYREMENGRYREIVFGIQRDLRKTKRDTGETHARYKKIYGGTRRLGGNTGCYWRSMKDTGRTRLRNARKSIVDTSRFEGDK
jgi:hypothetical protein